ncbi:patatin-like phospholipase family protein [Variovorax sp. GT1P44]|uniref:patatin-like phospholipase family protein n=1 Tax=Variovorax sp. GT1P44 TaxID=3443742 RepID=UPI003F451E9C
MNRPAMPLADRQAISGGETTLLDEVGVVSAVSGGSILAAYYAAFGDEVFTRFEQDFLLVNFQSGLIRQALSPVSTYRLTSPWWGRTEFLADRLDAVFRGTTFGDLRQRRPWPRLLVTATDLTTGVPFEFTPEQFALICSELESVPLSFAVAASSAVPILLSPVTVRNYGGSCTQSQEPETGMSHEGNLSARVLHRIAESYRNAKKRPYIHLVDGGVADNLGVRSLMDRTVASGSLLDTFRGMPFASVHTIVLVTVNSERGVATDIAISDRVPSTGQVIQTMVFGTGSRFSEETTEMVKDAVRRLEGELREARGRADSPFAADAEIYLVNVSLHDLKDSRLRQLLLDVPTAFEILPAHARELQAAGRQVLRENPEFQRLRRSLDSQSMAASIGPPGAETP